MGTIAGQDVVDVLGAERNEQGGERGQAGATPGARPVHQDRAGGRGDGVHGDRVGVDERLGQPVAVVCFPQ